MGDRRDLVRFARRARARLGLVRGVEASFRALFWVVVAALAGLLAARAFDLPIPWIPAAAVLGGLVLLAGLLAALLPRPGLLEAAARVDAGAGWKERLSSALALPAVATPMEAALVEDARERLRGRSVAALFPVRAPRELRWTLPAAAAFAAACLWMPPLDLLGTAEAAEKKKRELETVRLAAEQIEKKPLKTEKDGRPLDRAKEAARKLDALKAELSQSPPPERQEAMAKVSSVADEIRKMKDELSKSASLAEKLQKAASEKSAADAGKLGEMLRDGKLAEAAQELAKMRAALQSGKMSPEEKQKLLKQMEALKQQLAKDKNLGDLEKKLAQAMQGLQQDDEKMLEGLQQDLAQMDADQAEGEELAQALKDLDRLSDALAKGKGKCPSCDKPKEGEGG